MRLVIDPGHGAPDSGTVHNGIVEKDLTLELGFQLEDVILKTRWFYDVKMTRRVDRNLRNAEAGKIAHDHQADLVISIHVNGVVNPQARGLEVYHLSGDVVGREVADAICRAAPAPLRHPTRTVGKAAIGEEPHLRNIRAVLTPMPRPSVLVEVGFCSNPQDAAALKSDVVQRGIVAAMLCGALEAQRRMGMNGKG